MNAASITVCTIFRQLSAPDGCHPLQWKLFSLVCHYSSLDYLDLISLPLLASAGPWDYIKH